MEKQSKENKLETLERLERLPILEYRSKILELARSNPVVIIVGETGSGKTTQLPLILKELLEGDQKILITQPRRIATISIANYVADRLGCEIGEEVGYQIRFEDRTTEGTKINFVTDGILLRKIQIDPLLLEYSIIMIDEAHERSINIDLCLGLLKEIQRIRKEKNLPELKIIISSATLEKEKFQQFFENAPILEIEGKMYEVKEHYLDSPIIGYGIYSEAANLVRKIINETTEGDILIFMPGREEIEATAKEIERLGLPIEVLQLYGDMPIEEQQKIFYPGIKRRVIIATNIAETSITVPRIRYVIDSGLIKVLRYDSKKRYATLLTEKHSKAGCIQRKGRAGRLSNGEYYALFTKDDFESRSSYSEPEIKRSNLTHVILYMKNLGIDNIEEFDFIDPPTKEQIDEAIKDLKILGALDENGKITEIGKEMIEYPLDPPLARMIVEAIRNNYDCLYEICVITSFFGQRSVFVRPQNKQEEADLKHSRFKHPTSDFITLLKVWVEWKKNNVSQNWAINNFLNYNVLIEANKIVNDLLKILGRNGVSVSVNGYEKIEEKLKNEEELEKIEKCITAGLIGNVSIHDYRYLYKRMLDNESFYIFPGSALAFSRKYTPIITFLEPRESKGKKYGIFCQEVRPSWLVEVAPHLYKYEHLYYEIDPEGNVIEKVGVRFIKTNTTIAEIKIRPRNKEEASYHLARLLTDPIFASSIDKKNNIDVFTNNLKVIEEYNRYYLRSLGKLPKRDNIWLADFYAQKINGLLNIREVLDKVDLNELRISLDDLISEEERKRLEESYPEEIEINGKIYQISYEEALGDIHPFLVLSIYDLYQIKEPPFLPLGEIPLGVKVEGISRESMRYLDFKQAQTELRDSYIRNEFNKFIKENPPEEILTLEIDSEAQLEKIQNLEKMVEEWEAKNTSKITPRIYCYDPISNEPIYAYPFYTINSITIKGVVQYLNKYLHLEPFRLKIILEWAPNKEKADEYMKKYKEDLKKLLEIYRKHLLIKEYKNKLEQLKEVLEKCEKEIKEHPYSRFIKVINQVYLFISRDEIVNRRLEFISEEELKSLVIEAEENLKKIRKIIELKKKIEETLKGLLCPICKKPPYLYYSECRNFHDREYIKESSLVVVLQKVVNEKNQTIAEVILTEYDTVKIRIPEKDRRSRDIDIWEGDLFDEVRVIDLDKIIPEEEIEEYRRKRKIEQLERYKELLRKIIKKKPPSNYKYKKFVLGKNPKRQTEQFECKEEEDNKTIIYVISDLDVNAYNNKLRELVNFPLLINREELKVDRLTFQFVVVEIDERYLEILYNYVTLAREINPDKSRDEVIEEIEKMIKEIDAESKKNL